MLRRQRQLGAIHFCFCASSLQQCVSWQYSPLTTAMPPHSTTSTASFRTLQRKLERARQRTRANAWSLMWKALRGRSPEPSRRSSRSRSTPGHRAVRHASPQQLHRRWVSPDSSRQVSRSRSKSLELPRSRRQAATSDRHRRRLPLPQFNDLNSSRRRHQSLSAPARRSQRTANSPPPQQLLHQQRVPLARRKLSQRQRSVSAPARHSPTAPDNPPPQWLPRQQRAPLDGQRHFGQRHTRGQPSTSESARCSPRPPDDPPPQWLLNEHRVPLPRPKPPDHPPPQWLVDLQTYRTPSTSLLAGPPPPSSCQTGAHSQLVGNASASSSLYANVRLPHVIRAVVVSCSLASLPAVKLQYNVDFELDVSTYLDDSVEMTQCDGNSRRVTLAISQMANFKNIVYQTYSFLSAALCANKSVVMCFFCSNGRHRSVGIARLLKATPTLIL